MSQEPFDISPLFPNIAAQLRAAMGNLHLAAAQLVPASAREQDPELDARAALLDQSYYRLLRLVNNLTAAGSLAQPEPLPLLDGDLTETVRGVCDEARDLAELMGLRLVSAPPRGGASAPSTGRPSSSCSSSCCPTPSSSPPPAAP